jgi:S1-C subfamily serine protease
MIGGDIILAIDGNQVSTPQDLAAYIQNDQPGQVVILTILRNGNSTDIQVQLAARPSQTP